ncbi:hypothetical protein [Asticcacaulis taihuensis]|jgi:hypothetical protein|uniref:hypothetical protein n=1 Tax=Asticcacaulis taihuensis TaxID=260084 RepID=UPI003F7B66E0
MPADTIAPSRPAPSQTTAPDAVAAQAAAPQKPRPQSNGGARPRPDGLDRSEEGAATFVQASDGLKRMGAACMAVGSDNIAALTEAGALAGRLMTDMTRSYIDAVSYAAVTYAGLGRDCLTCRTPADVVEFQKKALEGFTETYEASSKVYSNLFEAFSTAFEPLMARAADGPERMFRAFAD